MRGSPSLLTTPPSLRRRYQQPLAYPAAGPSSWLLVSGTVSCQGMGRTPGTAQSRGRSTSKSGTPGSSGSTGTSSMRSRLDLGTFGWIKTGKHIPILH